MNMHFNLFFSIFLLLFWSNFVSQNTYNVYKKEQIITDITDTKCVKYKIAIKPKKISDNKMLNNILITIFE